MTDKQIIIDGEQCQYLRNTGLCRLTYCFTEKSYDYSMCKDNPNCYYKQLKAKEQECETLASQLDFEVQKKECLEQECEELKEILKDKTDKYNKLAVNYDAYVSMANEQLDQLKAENNLFRICHDNEQAKRRKFEQCLTEIKEIAMGIMDDDLDESSAYYEANKILQKISECGVMDE